jgi:hypothetical protein
MSEPDPHDRICTGCKLLFTPYSMAPDGQPVVVPPEHYECFDCRTRVAS